jgi:hypothetical protein
MLFNELHNEEYLTILKYNRNKDVENLSSFLEDLIISKSSQDYNFHRVDKLCILLTMYMVNVSPVVKLVGTCEETEQEYEISVDVAEVLNNLSNIDYKSPIVTYDNITIHLKQPQSLISTPITVKNMIDKISIDNNDYNISEATTNQFNQIIGHLPGRMFKYITDSIDEMNNKYNDTNLLKIYSPYVDDPNIIDINVNLFDDTIYELIRIIYGEDLNGFYELQFAMMHNYNFPPDYYMKITPTEAKIFYGYMKTDVAKKNKQIEDMKAQKKSPVSNITG